MGDGQASQPGGQGTAAAIAPRAPAKRRASEDPLTALLLDHAEPLYFAGPDGGIVRSNAAFRRLAPLLEVNGRALVAPHEVAERARETGQPVRCEHRVIDRDTVCTYHSEHRALFDDAGGLDGVVARFSRQDDGAALQDALTVSRARLDDITRLVSDWIWETDRELNFTYVSPRITEVLGFHPMELIGQPWHALIPDGGPLAGDAVLERPPRFRDREVEIPHRDGTPQTFRLSGVPVFDFATGRLAGFRGTAQDVTALKGREQALLQAKELAEQASRAKSEFLAQMSHELRTPLNAIIGFAEIMEAEALGAIGNAHYREYSSDIVGSARHLLGVINDVLDVAKIEAGRLELHVESVDPVEVAEAAMRTLAPRAHDGGVELLFRRPQTPLRLQGDVRKLRQVMINLVSNAVKFTPDGGSVTVGFEQVTDGGLKIAVSDTGIGMNPEETEVALLPFRQVDSRLARRFDGTGLGLPLSKALVELHDGELAIESAPDQGTTVSIVLPADRVLTA